MQVVKSSFQKIEDPLGWCLQMKTHHICNADDDALVESTLLEEVSKNLFSKQIAEVLKDTLFLSHFPPVFTQS